MLNIPPEISGARVMPKKSVSEERKEQIMKSLYKCLLKKQFHEITIKDIAGEAGINHGMIYYFYSSKEDVLLNFIDYISEQYRKNFIQYMNTKKAGALKGKALMRHAMNFSNEKITLNRNLSKIFIEIWSIASHNKKIRKKLRCLYEEWIFYIKEILVKTGISDEWADGISKATVSFFEGNALFSILFQWKKEQVKLILDEFQNRIIEIIDF
jgi:AcrR family transcriptional regulator